VWTAGHRIPVSIYADPRTYQRELDVFFYGPHWNYVGLEVEIPNAGDYFTRSLADESVIVTRDGSGAVRALWSGCTSDCCPGLDPVQNPHR